jgi:hypothetical protein
MNKSEYSHKYYLEHKEDWKHFPSQSKEKSSARKKKYVQEHPDRRKASIKKYCDAHKEEAKLYQKQHYQIYKARKNELRLALRKERYTKFFEMYGDRCACCGYADKRFLVLDHIKGQRGRRREISQTAYKRATEKYRPDEFRVLCHNCNHATRFGDICPHQIDKFISGMGE